MNLLQELQARSNAAHKSTDEEVQNVCDAIHAWCLQVADLGKYTVYVDSSDIEHGVVPQGCRESSFDHAFKRALTRIADAGVTVNTTSEQALYLLSWEA